MKQAVIHKAEQLYHLLLRLYPQEFKRRFGEEMKFVFSESLRHADEQGGSKRVFVLLGWICIDFCMSVLHEHWQARKENQPMNPINTLYAGVGVGELRQPSALKQAYELRANNELVGTLHWPTVLRSLCVAETVDESWNFERLGLLNSRVVARVAGSEQDVLTYRHNWTQTLGTLKHIDGREFTLRGSNWWRNHFTLVQKLTQGEDVELLTLKINFTLLRASADVTIHPQLARTEDAALLALFSCYLVLLVIDEMSGMS